MCLSWLLLWCLSSSLLLLLLRAALSINRAYPPQIMSTSLVIMASSSASGGVSVLVLLSRLLELSTMSPSPLERTCDNSIRPETYT